MNKTQDKKRSKKQNYFKKQHINLKKKENEKEKDLDPKNDFFQLDEQEKEHLLFLNKTYRDRAKERRDAESQQIEEEGQKMALDEDIQLIASKKGLDFDLFKKEKEKADEEHKESLSNLKKKENV